VNEHPHNYKIVEVAPTSVRIITRKRLNEFINRHPDAYSGMEHWYRTMKRGTYSTFAELRSAFPGVDIDAQ
jgi:mRNA interferase HigB